jgi:hypothetical protein
MKKRLAGLLYVGGVLGSLLMGAQAAMAELPGTGAARPPVYCWVCDGSGCWEVSCPE